MLEQFYPTQVQEILMTALLLQRSSVIKEEDDANFMKHIHPDLPNQSEIIKFAIQNATFKNPDEYYSFRTSVFYLDPLFERIELDLALNLVTQDVKPYDERSKESLIEIIMHPAAINDRTPASKILGSLLQSLENRRFRKYITSIGEYDFKQEVVTACKAIIKTLYKDGAEFYNLKSSLISLVVTEFIKEPSIAEKLKEDSYVLIKYMIANTSSIYMEDLKFNNDESVGVIRLINTDDKRSAPQSSSVFDELDDIIQSMKR